MSRADELFLNYIDGWVSRLPELDSVEAFKDTRKIGYFFGGHDQRLLPAGQPGQQPN